MTLFFPDISAFQAGIDLAGAHAVFVKATESTDYTNPDYNRAKANAASHGTYLMAYHFLHGGNAGAQAAYAHGVTGTTPLMIDVEANGATINDTIPFIDAYRKLGGRTYLVYLPHWYWQNIGSPTLKPLLDRKISLVSSAYTAYTDAATGTGWQPYGGMKPLIWQYTDKLHFNGQDVDFNAFRGHHAGDQSGAGVNATIAELKSIAETGAYPKAPPPNPSTPPAPKAIPADGVHSFRQLCALNGTTIDRALYLMANAPGTTASGHFGNMQAAFLNRGNADLIPDAGMTVWVG